MRKQVIFNELFENGISYKQYMNKSEKYLERMNTSLEAARKLVQRLSRNQVSRMNESLHVLCIAESWCIDCANGVPVIGTLSEKLPNMEFRIVSREEAKKAFKVFYSTAGRKKIPIIIFADEEGDEIMRWVERPMRSYQLLGILKDQNLSKDDFIKKYNDTLEFQPPFVSEEIFNELVAITEKSASIVHVNSPSKKRNAI
jgi:hypothetical protein